jgi:hypothetical protein
MAGEELGSADLDRVIANGKRRSANQKCEFPSILAPVDVSFRKKYDSTLMLLKTHARLAHAERSRRARNSELHMYPNRSLACMMQTSEVCIVCMRRREVPSTKLYHVV